MNKYRVTVVTHFPQTYITEVVEVEAVSPEEARDAAMFGDGFLISEQIDYGYEGEVEAYEVNLI